MLRKLYLTFNIILFLFYSEHTHAQVRDLLVGTPEAIVLKRETSQKPPIWKIPMGPSLVESMEIIGTNKLLVGLKKDFPGIPDMDLIVVDTQKGEILWTYNRKGDPGEYQLFLVFSDMLLFRVEKPKTVELLALNPETGTEIWRTVLKGKNIIPIPVFSHSQILTVARGENEISLTALNLNNGTTVWEQSRKISNGTSLPLPIVYDEHIFLFYSGIEKISPENGQSIYDIQNLTLAPDAPSPAIEGDTIYIVNNGNQLSAVSISKGNIIWSKNISPDILYTNIVPLNDKVYLRGLSKSGAHLLYAFHKSNGIITWDYSGKEASVSNLLEIDELLFFGTPSSLVALNKQNGNLVFTKQVTTTGRSFPVHIRQIDDQVIYIGELVVASYNSKNGQVKYSHGITPIAPDCHLNGLDYTIPNLKEEMSKYSGKPDNTLSQMGTNEMIKYQNMSRKYWSEYESARSSGNNISANINYQKYQINQSFAKMQATANLAFSIVELGTMVRNVINNLKIQTSIEKQELFRKSILDSYIKSESQNYVYRPHLKWNSVDDQFVTLSIIHLPTGKLRETYLSPQYLNYGLWNLVDFEKGVVYHLGIGMDPSLYKLSDARQYYPYKRARTIENFLIAIPLKIPE
jgi:outer membrane protein assembly factor BamB